MGTVVNTLAEIEKFVPRIVQQARAITVKDADDWEFACTALKQLDAHENTIDAFFDPDIQKAHQLHKSLVGKKNLFKNQVTEAKGELKLKIGQYLLEEKRQRYVKEQELAAIAKKEADERAMAEAAQLAANGEKGLADIVIQEAVAAPAPVVVLESSVPKQEGISGRTNWDFRIVDESKLPREFMSPDPVKIRAVVRSQKGMTKIPGVQAFPVHSVSVRSA